LQSKPPTRAPRAILRIAAIAATVAVLASGCATETVKRGYLPGYSDGEVTDQTAGIRELWVGSWVAALAVGLLTWGLMLWCVAAYRKRALGTSGRGDARDVEVRRVGVEVPEDQKR